MNDFNLAELKSMSPWTLICFIFIYIGYCILKFLHWLTPKAASQLVRFMKFQFTSILEDSFNKTLEKYDEEKIKSIRHKIEDLSKERDENIYKAVLDELKEIKEKIDERK